MYSLFIIAPLRVILVNFAWNSKVGNSGYPLQQKHIYLFFESIYYGRYISMSGIILDLGSNGGNPSVVSLVSN